MTPQVTNRREGGFMSCCGRSLKLRAFTWKELETVRAAQKLLGAPTISREECSGRGWWWREIKEENKPSSRAKMHKNSAKNRWFS
jgi:hypothetical protein